MGKGQQRFGNENRYARKLQAKHLDKVANPQTSVEKMSVVPVSCAVLAALLAFAVAWVQAQSKDLLPRYMMGPAIIGAVFSAMTAVLSVFGCFQLRKGDGYHDQAEAAHSQKQPERQPKTALDPAKLDHKSHPLFMWHWFLFGSAILTVLTVGSYVYIAICLVFGSDEFCVAYVPATSEADCKVKGNNGKITVAILAIFTIATGVLLFFLDKVVKDNLDYFAYRHQRLVDLKRREDDRYGEKGSAAGTTARAPPSYGDTTYRSRERRNSFGEDESDTDNSDFYASLSR
ncbi:uncharacterized protein JCM6883_003258 [Sporobolomyces salmoneus]|uniref:uncharacterized protein n=1 Tax=Sporobolomyces salmoneus TaxID=183962 RepID=UPI00318012E7